MHTYFHSVFHQRKELLEELSVDGGSYVHNISVLLGIWSTIVLNS